jgi:GntR family transcriptional regulator of vanillate catabolism
MTKRLKPGQHVIVSLRRMIASGQFGDGERIAEIPTAEALGVSRMPVRTALRALEQEGLVVRLGARGYAARSVSTAQVEAAIEVRGVLEGLAARRLASRLLDPQEEDAVDRCLARGEAIFAKGHLTDDDLEQFYDYNLAFHNLLIRASGNQAIEIALARNNHLPFASAAALVLDWEDREAEYRHLLAAHRQHCDVVDAIKMRDAGRAERIMRAHAQSTTGGAQTLERLATEAA